MQRFVWRRRSGTHTTHIFLSKCPLMLLWVCNIKFRLLGNVANESHLSQNVPTPGCTAAFAIQRSFTLACELVHFIPFTVSPCACAWCVGGVSVIKWVTAVQLEASLCIAVHARMQEPSNGWWPRTLRDTLDVRAHGECVMLCQMAH